MNKKRKFLIILVTLLTILSPMVATTPAYACDPCFCIPPGLCKCAGGCSGFVSSCSGTCGSCSRSQEGATKQDFTDELTNHMLWMVDVFFLEPENFTAPGLAAAMMLMTSQLTSTAMQQVEIIGTFFDAKHQLETQRLFQTLTAEAHKDYHPSQELCDIGTVTRPLAASNRKVDLSAQTISKRGLDRQLLSANTLEMRDGVASDKRSRLKQFIEVFCNPRDNSDNLDFLCLKGDALRQKVDINRDIDYTTTVDLPLTLDIDFSDPEISADERSIFALTSNLIAHETMPSIPPETLMSKYPEIPAYDSAASAYLDSRALAAKRSVAMNSLASIAALKANGTPEARPFIFSLIEELSPEEFDLKEVTDIIGENPSYYAQMEILTKKIYQNPKFYSNLYDKPANVLRKDVAIQAAELMQKRDIYRSLLRSEVVLAVMLEAALLKEQEKITNEINKGKQNRNQISPGIN